MSSADLPDFSSKREILYSDDVPVEKVNEVGRQFMAAGLYNDALEFFDRSKSVDDVQKAADIAFKDGDVAIWLRCKRILRQEPDEASLEGIAAHAETHKKYAFAIEAWRRLGNDEQVARLRAASQAESS